MKRRPIDFPEFQVQPYSLLARQWLVLTCGDIKTGRYNSMTVGWGSFGVMWNKPFVQVVVRPTRYTFEFMNRYNTFTLCALGKKYREALQILGTRSGRDGNKIAETGLTPVPSTKIAAPGFAEAQLIIELRKMYWEDFKPENFLDPSIEENYPQKDYHRMFFGEILAIFGTGEYSII
jgi:flavin reductase (DIM6/NTAB) family NADH-FMN oxidoreductase RutF